MLCMERRIASGIMIYSEYKYRGITEVRVGDWLQSPARTQKF